MRVALFVHCFLPKHFYGTEVYTLQVAKNLRELGYEVTVVSANFTNETKLETEVTYYEYEGLPVYCIDKNYSPYTRIKDTYYQPIMRDVLTELLLKIKPDIVHVTHLMNHSAMLLEVAKMLSIPTVATLTDFFGICYNSQLRAADGSLCCGPNGSRINCLACRLKDEAQFPGEHWLHKWLRKYPWFKTFAIFLNAIWKFSRFKNTFIEALVADIKDRPETLKKLYENYRAVIAPTKFLSQAYVDNGLSVPIHISHFGVDSSRSPKPARDHNSAIKFAFIGQIYPHKGTDILVEAFCRLPKGSAELLIYGKEDQSPEFTNKLRKMAAGYSVFFRGTFPQTEIDTIFAEVDFLVIPSIWYENSPLVLLNSLASHTPVIISDVAGMTEFVEKGRNGYIFKRGSAADLERVLQNIIKDPGNARELAHSTEYTRTTKMMVEDVVEVYNEIMSKVI